MSVSILVGDSRDVLRTLPDNSIHCCVTSPPYFGLRDYGVDGQMGLEPTPDAYVDGMVALARDVRRLLRDDGTLWMNLGDSYANDGKWGGSTGGKHAAKLHGHTGIGRRRLKTGLKPKNLVGIPWRVAFALQGFALVPGASLAQWADWLSVARANEDWQMVAMVEDRIRATVWIDALTADGWYLRQDIIWYKPNPMPESVEDRCTKAHEYVFLLSKSPRYYFDAAAIEEGLAPSSVSRLAQNVEAQVGSARVPGKTNGAMKAVGGRRRGVPPRHEGYASSDQSGPDGVGRGEGRNKRSVWTIATQPFSEAHFATMPPKLAETCILAGCPEGGTVLDPFGGAGTTGLVADRLQRNAILIELNPAYADMARKRIAGDAGLFGEVA